MNQKIKYILQMLAASTLVVLILTYILIDGPSKESFIELGKSILTEALAILVIFLVVNFFLEKKGLSPSKLLVEDIHSRIQTVLNRKKGFLTQKEAAEQYSFKEMLSKSKEIYLLGFSLFSLISDYKKEITESIHKGLKIHFLILKPNSSGAVLLEEESKTFDINKDIERSITLFKEITESSKENKSKGSINLRLITWIPSASLFISDPAAEGIMRIRFYPITPNFPFKRIITHKVIHKKDDEDLFNYFWDQYKELDKTSESPS